jgi:hypothetical protein
MGPNLTKNFPSFYPLSLILGKCPRNIVIFRLTQTKNVFFLEPKFLQKEKITGGPNFFSLRGQIFLLDWPKNLRKEMATLVPVQAGDGALDTQQHHRNTAAQHNTAQVKISSDFWSKQRAANSILKVL